MEYPYERTEIENSISEGLSILIVDNRDEAFTLEQDIRSLGYIPQVAFRYSDIFEKIKKSKFDLIFIDMNLPEGDCVRIIEKIRNLLGDIYIITMTGNNSREIEELAREQKVIYHIVKPMDFAEMSSVILHISKKEQRRIRVKEERAAKTDD